MGRHFSKVGATVILGSLKQKSQGARAPHPSGSDAYGAIVWWRKHDNIFSRFDTVPACDGQTDGQTDVQMDGQTSSLYLLRASA